MNRIAVWLALTVGLALPVTASRAAELIMFEGPGCAWCARFNAEIAPIYGNTDESRAAPLRRVDLNSPPSRRSRRNRSGSLHADLRRGTRGP